VTDAIIINSLLSTGLIVGILYLDRYEREPIPGILLLFLFSIGATFLYSIIITPLIGNEDMSPFTRAFFQAAIPEELLKFALLYYVVCYWKSFNEAFDVIVYMTIIAAGFALFENINYYLEFTYKGSNIGMLTGNWELYNAQLVNIVGVRAVPGHILIDISAAYVFCKIRDNKNLKIVFLMALTTAIFLHGLWNYLVEAWMLFYVFLLTLFAAISVIKLLNASVYLDERVKLDQLIDFNIYMADHGFSEDDYENCQNKSSIILSLQTVKRLLKKLQYLPGEQQKRLMNYLKEHLPFPVVNYTYNGENGIADRLSRIISELSQYKDIKLDWSYYLMVYISILFSAIITVSVCFLIGRMIYS